MAFENYANRVGPYGYKHVIPRNTIAIVQDSNPVPFHQALSQSLEDALKRRSDEVIHVSDKTSDPLPDRANSALQFFDLRSGGESRPRQLLQRFSKTGEGKKRADKKAIAGGSFDEIPIREDLTAFARTQMGRRATHFAIIAEGAESQRRLNPGQHVLIASMEGNTALFEAQDQNPDKVFDQVAQRFAFLSNAEMVSLRVGEKTSGIKFNQWVNDPAVRALQESSHILANAGLVWDLDLGAMGLSRPQQTAIMLTLKTAGLGEGMQWALTTKFGNPILAVTETGVSKTDTDPAKGNVVPVYGATEYGSSHYILQGYPKGHIINLFTRPSRMQLHDTLSYLLSAYLRGKLSSGLKDMLKGQPIWMDHPGSIETHESVLFVMLSSLLESGKRTNFRDGVDYLANGFQKTNAVLPVIPENTRPGARSGIHTHNSARIQQSDQRIKVTNADMEGFGYPHSPPCGSREATLLLLKAMYDSYEDYGPLERNDYRVINLPGHGSFSYSVENPTDLASALTRTDWFDHVPRY